MYHGIACRSGSAIGLMPVATAPFAIELTNSLVLTGAKAYRI